MKKNQDINNKDKWRRGKTIESVGNCEILSLFDLVLCIQRCLFAAVHVKLSSHLPQLKYWFEVLVLFGSLAYCIQLQQHVVHQLLADN